VNFTEDKRVTISNVTSQMGEDGEGMTGKCRKSGPTEIFLIILTL
jgi:hypothetical protein